MAKKKGQKLCPRGKAAAKAKFDVYPSAYANAYASKVCAGKVKGPGGKKRKDFRGPKPAKEGTFVESGDTSGSVIEMDIDGMAVSNPSARAYYKGLV